MEHSNEFLEVQFTFQIPKREGEEWRIVKDYPHYAISNYGRLFYTRICAFMKPQKNHQNKGYVKVCIRNNKGKRFFFIHRIVALNFIENPHNKPYINHIDGNPANNHISNLEWATPSENTQHSYNMGLQVMPTNRAIGEARSKKLKTVDVVKIKSILSNRTVSYDQIGKLFSVTGDTIRAIDLGKSWKHLQIPSLITAGLEKDCTI